jgi:hypothetical protein
MEYVAKLIPGAIAQPHPQQVKMGAASDAELGRLAAMLTTWLDGPLPKATRPVAAEATVDS